MRKQISAEMIKALPKEVGKRVVVLKNMQMDQLKLEAEFYEEVYALEKKFHAKFTPLFDARRQIVTGEIDPEEQEPKWKPEDEETERLCTEKFKDYRADIEKLVVFYC